MSKDRKYNKSLLLLERRGFLVPLCHTHIDIFVNDTRLQAESYRLLYPRFSVPRLPCLPLANYWYHRVNTSLLTCLVLDAWGLLGLPWFGRYLSST